MAKTVSTNLHQELNRLSAEAPLTLLEIDHADLTTPVRVVQDNQDLVHQSNTFTALAFRITMPNDPEEGLPRAKLALDNVGKELITWLEASNGGQGASCRIMQVRRAAPDVVEWEITMDLDNVSITMLEVSGSLGFDDVLNLPGLPFTYRPDTAPGLF